VLSTSRSQVCVLSIDQYVQLLKHSLAYFRPFLIMAFNTGMRKGEIKKLRWSYIDRDNMIIRLPKKITKEKRDKDIPINHNVKDVLDSLPRSIVHDYVITHLGKPVKERGQLRKQFPDACRKAGIPYGTKVSRGIIFHDIRRTVKTNMVCAGVDKALRDTILGHSLKGMDVNYIALTDDMLTEAMDKYTMWLDNQLAFANVDQIADQSQV